MTVNTATWLNHRKQFFRDFKIIFPYYAKRASFITSGLLQKAGIQFWSNNVLRNEEEEY